MLYLERPRINELLGSATQSKLVYVIAGAGYGKTQVVRRYVESHADAIVRYMQLSENDNVASRYWENLCHSIRADNPDLADRLCEFGFPDTPTRIKQFSEIIKTVEHKSHRTFLILDDFHLIHSEEALTFAERCANLNIPGACVIIISCKEPQINTVSLYSKGQLKIITEKELTFTDTEISDFLKLQSLPVSSGVLKQFADATKGWPLAIHLLSMSLKRKASDLSLSIATMKENIFKLMEAEAFSELSLPVQKYLVKLSLICLPLKVMHELYDSELSLQERYPQLSAFISRNPFTGDENINPLYLEFLHSKLHILTDEEKTDTYKKAATWCLKNAFTLDAMYYLAVSHDYDRMIELFFSYPFRLPHDMCEYFLTLIEKFVSDDMNGEKAHVILKNFFPPLLNAGMGKYDEARQKALDIIAKWENSDLPIAPLILSSTHSNLAYIDMFLCTVTHEYKAAGYIKKSIDYLKLSKIPPYNFSENFLVPDIRFFSCYVGEGASLEKFDEFAESTKQSSSYIAETPNNMYYGFDDLLFCELAFFRNQPDKAKTYALSASLKAQEKKQYSIKAMAASYLLRISLQQGDYTLTREVLKQLRLQLDNENYATRHLLHDLYTGFFYTQIGLPELVPSWLHMDEPDTASEIRLPLGELIVCVKSHIALKEFSQALTILCYSYPRKPEERFIFSELTISLLMAVARIQTGDTAQAMRDFERAYSLSFDGEFEMPFIELGKNLRPLVTEALKQEDFTIPEDWLKAIERKASIYAKKTAVIMDAFKRERKIEDSVTLSDREVEVLSDLYHGLSREEIAESRYLSINTVKKILQSIYIKLDANNSADAIRIGIKKSIIR